MACEVLGERDGAGVPINPKKVAQAARRGLLGAQRRHESWSGWWWPPPEYVATVAIAEAVSRLEGVDWVTPEHNVRDTLRLAGGGIGRPAGELPKQGRFDVVVWSGSRPAGVIEVKTRGYSTLEADAKRVCAAIRNAPGIRWGMVAFIYAWGEGEQKPAVDRVRDRTGRLAAKAEDLAQGYGMTFRRHRAKIRQEDEGAWVPVVFEFRARQHGWPKTVHGRVALSHGEQSRAAASGRTTGR